MNTANINSISDYIHELPAHAAHGMIVPARFYCSRSLLEQMDSAVLQQLINVASLPGIQSHAMCMPDGHSGYGFPIGGAAAIDAASGVISPGGIGFDINCGVRLTVTSLTIDEVRPKIKEIINRFFSEIPCGTGSGALLPLKGDSIDEALSTGAGLAVKKGLCSSAELQFIEDNGTSSSADPSSVSDRARDRGAAQCGSLGSGNHYLELQYITDENIFNREKAEAFGIHGSGQVAFMIHCGSRGLGHQIATDYLKEFNSIMGPKFGLKVKDRELACVPFMSEEGQRYFRAMSCAVNFAFLNRHLIDLKAREIIASVLGRKPHQIGAKPVYDVCHNNASLEKHIVNGREKKLIIHRKGATRALPPGSEHIPQPYRKHGQPVIIGGSMESGSCLLAGTASGAETFFTTAHGSGRLMSRGEAKRKFNGRDLADKMLSRGIYVQTPSFSSLAEEAGGAYKQLDDVIASAEGAGLSVPVAKLIPVGNVKA
jgi:tRNA-splicing ligase RtcB